jgi:hypothetical protein
MQQHLPGRFACKSLANWVADLRKYLLVIVVFATTRHRHWFLGFRSISDSRVGRQQKPGDRRGILQGSAHYFCRINDSRRSQILKLSAARIETPGAFHDLDFANNYGAVYTGVFGNPP